MLFNIFLPQNSPFFAFSIPPGHTLYNITRHFLTAKTTTTKATKKRPGSALRPGRNFFIAEMRSYFNAAFTASLGTISSLKT